MTKDRKRLDAKTVEKLRAEDDKIHRYFDGPASYGLFLEVKKSKRDGRQLKAFYQRLTIDGKRRDRSLGSYPDLSLGDARLIAAANVKMVKAGSNPSVKEEEPASVEAKPEPAVESVPTFSEAAEAVIALRAEGKKGKTIARERNFLRYHMSTLLDRKVDEITRQDVLGVLYPLRQRAPTSARTLEAWLTAIFEWAIGTGARTDNPFDSSTKHLLPVTKHKVTNRKSLPHQDLEDFVLQIESCDKRERPLRLAFELQILLASRPGEPLGAQWGEIHPDYEVFKPKTKGMPSLYWPCWVIPEERYKIGREMVFPLPRQALKLLVEAIPFSHLHPTLIFPSSHGIEFYTKRLNLIQHQFNDADAHGSRDSFKTWVQDYDIRENLAETALGHSISTHGGAYGRSILASKRIYLMQDWSDYNTGEMHLPYEWNDRFKPERPDTYPEKDKSLIQDDLDVLRAHLESDIAGRYFSGIQHAYAAIQSTKMNSRCKLLILFRALTGTVLTQVTKAKVSDINADTRIWTIPAAHNRKQSGESFHVPLSDEAFAVHEQALDEIDRGDSNLLFPSRVGTRTDASTISRAWRKTGLNVKFSVLTAAFREWALASGVPEDLVCEAVGRTWTKPLADLQNPSEAFTEWVVAPDQAAGQESSEDTEDQAAGQESSEDTDGNDSAFTHLRPMTEKDLELRWEAQVKLMQDWANFLQGKD